ncbi:MAG: FAD-binding oxidoreductase [Allorhizobium sp.]
MTTGAELVSAFAGIVGGRYVLTAGADVARYVTDWKRSSTGTPACVVRPASTAEVADVIKVCREHGAAVVPQGGNTGLAAGAIPDTTGTEVVLSLNRMQAIRSLDPIGMTVEVEAGAILQTVRETATAAGRMLPIAIAAEGSATIGGVIATNAGGLNVLRYGMTRDLTLGLEVVLADGTVATRLRHLRKDNAGYDWKQWFIGSEGTLGIVTAAVMRLVPVPRHTATALLSVSDLDAAIALFGLAQEEIGEALSAFELISEQSVELVERHFPIKSPIAAGKWCILIEASSSLSGLRDATEAVLAAGFEKGWVVDGVVAESEAQVRQLWALRENVTEAEAKHGPSLKHDISVPLVRMRAFLTDASAAVSAVAPSTGLNLFGHLGDGNLHYNVLTKAGHDAAAINRAVHDAVDRHGGSISAEHGIGRYRVDEWMRIAPEADRHLAETIKTALDPNGLLNPGKVIPAGRHHRGSI